MHCGNRHRARCGHHGGQDAHHARHGRSAASCGCGCETHGWRRFQTKEEAVERLEGYLQDLQKEVQAVEERIAALKAE